MDEDKFKKLELEKKKTIAISGADWTYLFWRRLFGCRLKMNLGKYERRNNRLKKLALKGEQKLMQDFDISRLNNELKKLKVLFDYYFHKHSDIMIAVNSTKTNVINLEEDQWDDERAQPYLTRFNTFQSSSSDE